MKKMLVYLNVIMFFGLFLVFSSCDPTSANQAAIIPVTNAAGETEWCCHCDGKKIGCCTGKSIECDCVKKTYNCTN